MTEPTSRMLRGLGELHQDIAPGRDLWPAISAAISAAPAAQHATQSTANAVAARSRAPRFAFGIAASVALLLVGAWAGRNLLPATAPATLAQAPAAVAPPATGVAPQAAGSGVTMAASFELDAVSRGERQRRLDALAGQLAALPPQTQAQVKASIAAIEKGVLDIQAALGRDPGNLLLQEMLVSSYQEEMRVLGAVDEANRAATGPGI